MKQIPLLLTLLAASAPAVSQSVFDENPACMDRNGPHCVLRSEIVGPRVIAGAGPTATTGAATLRGIPAVNGLTGTATGTTVDGFRRSDRTSAAPQSVDAGAVTTTGDIGGSTTAANRQRGSMSGTGGGRGGRR
ncbi:MAG: hypothetical protein JWN94_172 [Betaproteobacteria bacterium]|nr:hypothetical protein [Betaproteobacteria bacterium]